MTIQRQAVFGSFEDGYAEPHCEERDTSWTGDSELARGALWVLLGCHL